ncbi:MAG: hypothetical protein SGPRY_006908 [Prymnesium sp.]
MTDGAREWCLGQEPADDLPVLQLMQAVMSCCEHNTKRAATLSKLCELLEGENIWHVNELKLVPTQLMSILFDESGLQAGPGNLARACSTEEITFAQCMFGASTQKYTTLWMTAGLTPYLRALNGMVCVHAPEAHDSAAGGKQLPDGKWNSAATSAYPPDLNLHFADVITQLTSTNTPPCDLQGDAIEPPPTAQPPTARRLETGPPANVATRPDIELPLPPRAPDSESQATTTEVLEALEASDEDHKDTDDSTVTPTPRPKRKPAPIFIRGAGAYPTRSRTLTGAAQAAT